MSKVITFSRTFPSYHPKAGQPTYFVEKVLRSIFDKEHIEQFNRNMQTLNTIGGYDITKLELKPIDAFEPKHHTIRAGHRFKAGDWFSPRVWSGKPYNSKQIQFAPDIQVKKTWDIDIHGTDWYLDGRHEYTTGWDVSKETIAQNDGLNPVDFYDWFTLSPDFKRKEEFFGQIICWNESIEY